MIKKIHLFNMIEILLALTVIAIGMTSVLGLFPVGLNASRNAIAQNCSADVADQMVTYLSIINESVNRNPSTGVITTPTNYDDNIISTSGYQTAKYSDVDIIKTQSEAFLAKYKADDVGAGSSSYVRVAKDWAIFKNKAVTGLDSQMFFVVQGPNSVQDGGSRNIDYSAMMLIWKSPVQIKRYDGINWIMWPLDADIYTNPPTNTIIKTSTAFKYSAKINIELSWPLELPYEDRKTRYYQVIITNPNP